jgi:hypothetical protein
MGQFENGDYCLWSPYLFGLQQVFFHVHGAVKLLMHECGTLGSVMHINHWLARFFRGNNRLRLSSVSRAGGGR